MLLFLTKTNCIASNTKQIYLNHETIIYFEPYGKDKKSGSEISLINGSIIHVKETPDDIANMHMEMNVVCPGPKRIDPAEGDVKSAARNEKRSTNGKQSKDESDGNVSGTVQPRRAI